MEVDLSKKDEISQAAQTGAPISLPLLQIISEARNEHGMRQQDFARYRRFCASKVHRLRELLKVTHADDSRPAEPRKSKAAKKQARSKKSKKAGQPTATAQSEAARGHANVFTPKTLDVSKVENERPALLLLFEAERAWAYSQELRNEAFDNDSDPAVRKRGISRLRRAEQWSQALAEMVKALSPRFDVYTRAEAVAYQSIIRATTAFDRSQWERALQTLSVARSLLNAIAQNSKTSRGEALANSFVDAGEAQMRYSAYQLGNADQDMDKVARATATSELCDQLCPGYSNLVDELAAAKAKGGETAKHDVSLSWHGQQIHVRNPELLDTVVHAQAEEAVLRESVQIEALGQEAQEAQLKKSASQHQSKEKRVRLSHAQRKAKKRESASAVSATAASAQGEASGSASTATARLGKGGRTELDPFDRALSALTDAEDVARRLVDDNAEALSKSHSARYETASKDLQTAHDFIFYRLLALRVWRNLRLVADVERRAERREKRAMVNVEAHFGKGVKKSASSSSSASRLSKKSRAKKIEAKKAARATRAARPKQPGTKSKKNNKKAIKTTHRPGRSGTRALRTRQALARENRARRIAADKSKRRGARAVPSLAKLLDAAETSLVAMGSIGLVESEPDVSSLVEAKAAWFRSEVLRHLARAFALSGAHAEAVLLLTRAQLYIRQARQAADLAEDVDEEDSDFPPRVKAAEGGESVFDHSDAVLVAQKRQIQKGMYLAERAAQKGKGKAKAKKAAMPAMSESRAGQALLDMARKHVDFDPISLNEARQIPNDVRAEAEAELEKQPAASGNQTSLVATKKGVAQAVSPAAAPPAKAAGAVKKVAVPSDKKEDTVAAMELDEASQQEPETFQDDEEDELEQQAELDDEEAAGDVSIAYDPGNALAEEEEARLEAEAAAKKKGWLGGWFGRG
ncbi:hypothetical protein BCV70DRAFT_197392 [Testicularia cyperi]|uniref:Signal recognition particle subunit SRP68 n=1 Tax=Testicularia cyperi TaxID=1882483 RepID=A0A317XZD5_9BASI|nr:hypothetical protein BCV70DRAFT_197392 [Testicularia cyperi]